MRNAAANAIIEAAKKDPNIYLITGDAGLGVWDGFRVGASKSIHKPGGKRGFVRWNGGGMGSGDIDRYTTISLRL